MPRYFFHFIDGSTQVDNDGVELPGKEAAHRHVVQLASDWLFRNRSEQPGSTAEQRILVTDQDHTVVGSIKITERFGPDSNTDPDRDD